MHLYKMQSMMLCTSLFRNQYTAKLEYNLDESVDFTADSGEAGLRREAECLV